MLITYFHAHGIPDPVPHVHIAIDISNDIADCAPVVRRIC
jgi:hypothetical protein